MAFFRHVPLAIFFAASVFVAPLVAHGAVMISEIMYDVPGTDTKREWIEVRNTGSEAVDLTKWKLFEEGTNHALTVTQGDGALAPGGYPVIADNTASFLVDQSGFSGLLFDSSFSLKNTGEPLTLRDESLADIDTVTYSMDGGGAGDGNTLQWNGSEWIAAAPTPGAANATEAAPAPTTPADKPTNTIPSSEDTTNTNPPVPVGSNTGSAPPPSSGSSSNKNTGASAEQPLSARVKVAAWVIAGTDVVFEALLSGKGAGTISEGSVRWNFGDGTTGTGRKTGHTYIRPGTYAVVAKVTEGEGVEARASIVVEASPISIARVEAGADGFVTLGNASKHDIDLSGWRLAHGESSFRIPDSTLVLSGAELTFDAQVTGVVVVEASLVSLLLPNMQVAARFGESVVAEEEAPRAGTTSAGAQEALGTPVVATSFVSPSLKNKPMVQSSHTPSVSDAGSVDMYAGEASPEASAASPDSFAEAAPVSRAALPLSETASRSSSRLLPWLVALAALVGLGVAGALATKRPEPVAEFGPEDTDEAARYTIVEDNDE